jgi:Xaa-Pro dipeptidase
VELLRHAAKITDMAMAATVEMMKPGVTAREVEDFIIRFGEEHGATDLAFEPNAIFTCKGSHTSRADMGLPKTRQFLPGTTAAFDFGFVLNGYSSDYGRSFHCGKAPQEYVDAYKALQEGEVYAVEHIVPGESNINDVYRNIQKSVEKTSSGYLLQYKEDGTNGHQIGIDVHELPWLYYPVENELLYPNMVFCSEPKMWFLGDCYMRVEDMILVTEKGAEFLTTFDRDLFEINL